MKRIFTYLIVGLLMVLGLQCLHAQVVDVCAGNDTVELRLSNFQYGYVQWQVSDDNEMWYDIDGAIDTVYRFLPDRPRYYRAEVKFPACSEYDYHSQVSYVQIPPKAFAGPDLTLPAGTVARMNATNIDGASGAWEIIQGTGGLLEDPNDCRSGFIGEEGEYKLTWTVTNSCGSNTDTVSIKCVHMEYQTDLVIVDETDAILSDSTQRLNGEYIICFNDPVPEIHEGSVLMGYMYPSFLRKVISFEREGNLFTMQTEAGALTDVIVSGAINIDQIADTTNGRKPVVKYLDRFPTRKEMQENPFLLRDGSVYFIKNTTKEASSIDFDFVVELTTEGYLSFKLLEFDFKKIDNKLDGLKYSSEIRFYPNFNADFVFENFDFKEARIGFYDARLEHIQRIRLTKPLTTTLVDKNGYFNKTQYMAGGFLIGLIPTFIMLDFPYEFKVEASIEPPLSITKTTGNTYTFDMYYNGQTNHTTVRKEKGTPYQHTTYENPIGSIGAKFKMGIKASVLLLDVFGPYFEVDGNFDPSICASSETGDIGGNINMGVDLKLGCRFQLFSNRLTLFDKCFDFRVVDYNEPAPKKVLKNGGDNQVYTYGQYLYYPVGVKVKGWFGTPMPWAYVHFAPENGGSVSDSIVATDIHGVAETRWKPGTHYGMDKLKVKVYDCYGNLAGETPLTFYAYSSATDPCINSNLTVEAYDVNENTIIPLVNGGKSPFLYSTDGVSYSQNKPTIHTEPGHVYHFYVRDNNGCEAETSYTAPRPSCDNSSLQVGAEVSGNSITVYSIGWFQPHLYSIGGDFQLSNTFHDLYDGEYTVTVRDRNGCERSTHVVISRPGNLNISITEITNGSGNAMVMTQTNTLIDKGICWSTHHSPTVQDFHNTYGPGTGYYTFTITALDPNKTYYVRAYALDASGTSYSREVCINPAPNNDIPVVAATGVTNVTTTTAVLSGNVTYEGSSPVTERGVCWGLITQPTVGAHHLPCGSGTGAFSADISGLTTGLHYYARAYATNSYGTAYGKQVEFDATENGGEYIPWGFSGQQVYYITTESVQYEGYVTIGSSQMLNKGACWSTSPNPTIADQYVEGTFSNFDEMIYGVVHGLVPNTTYYLRVFVTDSHQTYYSDNVVFTTLPEGNHTPQVVTTEVTDITSNSATCWMQILSDGGSSILGFGVCYSTHPEPTINDNYAGPNQAGDYGIALTGLVPNTTYYARAYAFNSMEAGYGNELSFTTLPDGGGGGDEHEYVDLGLPSGTLWATCNVGANSPEENGDYFAWGETQPKNVYNWSTYQYSHGESNDLIKYCSYPQYGYNGFTDTLTQLERSDDAATANWGGAWCTPTKLQWDELINNTSGTWSTLNGINGYLFTSTNGNSLFFPLAGFQPGDLVNSGSYWTSTIDYYAPTFATLSYLQLGGQFYWDKERCIGCSVRPVRSREPLGDLPQVTTLDVVNITLTSATCGGNVVSDGGTAIIERGICWGPGHNPTIYEDHSANGSGMGTFYLNISGLSPSTTYYVRAYATNATGTSYGNEVYFTTPFEDFDSPEGAIHGLFSVGDGRHVCFSKGNLQYIGSAPSPYWKFAEKQWDCLGNNGQGSDSPNVDRDLFGWGTSGYNHGAINYQPWSTDWPHGEYYYAYGNMFCNLYDRTGKADWGYNAISNGGNMENIWRTLTQSEWNYIINDRITTSNIRFAKSRVNGIAGVILLPDNWTTSLYIFNNTNQHDASYNSNIITESQWVVLEQSGAVFLPVTGWRTGTTIHYYEDERGCYWSSSEYQDTSDAYLVIFEDEDLEPSSRTTRGLGSCVRLVHDIDCKQKEQRIIKE